MNKILIIDDTKKGYDRFFNLLSDEELVKVSKTIEEIYDIEAEKFKKDVIYDLVFLHQSFKEDKVSSEIVSIVEKYVTDEFPYKLIRFTGGNNVPVTVYDPDDYNIYMHRSQLSDKIIQFINFSKLINRWFLQALIYDDYQKIFFRESLYSLKRITDKYSVEYKKILTDNLKIMGYEINDIKGKEDLIIKKIEEKANE